MRKPKLDFLSCLAMFCEEAGNSTLPKLPKTLAACGDQLYELQHARYELNKQLEKIREAERVLEERIINELPKDEASGISGKVATVRILRKVNPVVDTQNNGWDKVWGWIRKQKGNDGFSILGKSLNKTALKEIQEAGKEVPGLTTFTDLSVSCTKVKR